MRRERSELYPAMAASAGLHSAVLLAGIIAWPWLSHPTKVIEVVPVTLMTQSEMTDVRSAIAAPEPSPAQTETPIPDAPPEMAAPIQQPEPAPPQPQPQPQPKPAPPKPAPAKPTPAKPVPPAKSVSPTKAAPTPSKTPPQKPTATTAKPTPAPGFDFDALAASVAKAGHPAGQRQSSAQKGPSRPETDLQSRPSAGAARAATADAINAIASKLARLWNPNCGIEGAANVVVKVRMELTPQGALMKDPPDLVGDYEHDPVKTAAALRAQNAVSRGAPFTGLPPETYAQWRSLPVTFDAKQICQGM